MKSCECGCGQLVKNRFVHGHNIRGISPWNIGISPSKETILKMKKSGGNRKDCVVSEETKCKQRKNHKGMSGKSHSKGTIEKMRKSQQKSQEFKDRIKEKLKGHSVTEKTKQKIREKRKLQICSEETRTKLSISTKLLWKNPDFVKKVQASQHITPNKPESKLFSILNNLFPNEWKFTGDFSFIINGKNPDFVNCNGQKKIIELYGDYWHRNDNPQDRINLFSEFGYDTLIIWESELKDQDVLIEKLKSFCK